MHYYRAVDPETKRLRLFTRKDLAAKLDPNFDEIDIPTDKDGLMEVLQDLIDHGPPIGEVVPPVVEIVTQIDPRLHCPKCKQTQKGAAFLAEYRIQQLFADKLDELPPASIPRAAEILTSRLLEIARETETALKALKEG